MHAGIPVSHRRLRIFFLHFSFRFKLFQRHQPTLNDVHLQSLRLIEQLFVQLLHDVLLTRRRHNIQSRGRFLHLLRRLLLEKPEQLFALLPLQSLQPYFLLSLLLFNPVLVLLLSPLLLLSRSLLFLSFQTLRLHLLLALFPLHLSLLRLLLAFQTFLLHLLLSFSLLRLFLLRSFFLLLFLRLLQSL